MEYSGSRVPDAESVKVMLSLIITFYLTKTENRTKKLKRNSHTIALSKGTIFVKKTLIFYKKILTSAKLRGRWYYKVYFLKLNMCEYLRAKFEVSSMILTSFRQEGGEEFNPPPIPPRTHTLSPQNEPLKSPPRLGLKSRLNYQYKRKNSEERNKFIAFFWCELNVVFKTLFVIKRVINKKQTYDKA